MSKKSIRFDDYLERELRDPKLRELFLQQREALRLGVEIARLRKEVGLSQGELAARAGMLKQNVARLERPDYRSFTLGTLQRLALALGRELQVSFAPMGQTRKG